MRVPYQCSKGDGWVGAGLLEHAKARGTVVHEYKEALFLWCVEKFGVDRADFKTKKRRERIDLKPIPAGA